LLHLLDEAFVSFIICGRDKFIVFQTE